MEKKRTQEEIITFLKSVDMDNAEDVLEFVLEPLFSEIRAGLINNTTSRSYYRMTKLIKSAIELLYQKEQCLNVILIDGSNVSIMASEFSCTQHGIHVEGMKSIYFNEIIELRSIYDRDNIYQNHDEDEFVNAKDGLSQASKHRVRQLL